MTWLRARAGRSLARHRRPALIAVQGSALTDPEAWADLCDIPAHEEVAVLPWSLLESYARERR